MNHLNTTEYGRLLGEWVRFSQRHLYACPEREGYLCYGAGEHGHWGVHTHQKAFAAFAVAAIDPQIDWPGLGLAREAVLEQALAMLRYNLATHLSGDFVCSDGGQWGHNWIYVLGLERMMHAVEALESHLTGPDRDALRRVLISEADFLLNEYPVSAGLIRDNKPESNIWNGAALYRCAALYPDAPNAAAYQDKALAFFANGISLESDEKCLDEYDGKALKDLFVGANFFDSYGCNHHGYLNVGYMVICLSNIAMLHFSFKAMGKTLPPIVYHNMKGLWRLIRTATYEDGRLFRFGGDSRARYCYCQDYVLPMWALVEDLYGEDCSGLEAGWLSILQRETAANGDGSFLSSRIGPFEERSPLYYTRLESDRASVVSMALRWHRLYGLRADKAPACLSAWHDEYHGACLEAGGARFASFVWRASEKPQAHCLPKADSSLAEWRFNLAGHIEGVGLINDEDVAAHTEHMFSGGFLTYGHTVVYSDRFLAEGQLREDIAKKRVAFAALPDGAGALCVQYAKALNRCYVATVRGVQWSIPNDIFNGRSRRLALENGRYTLRGGEFANRREIIEAGRFANVDDAVGLACLRPLRLVRAGKRQVDIKGRSDSGTLYCEEVCAQFSETPHWVDRGEMLIDLGFAVSLGNAAQTERLACSLTTLDLGDAFRSVVAKGADGRTYALIVNISDGVAAAQARGLRAVSGPENLSFQAGEAGLYLVE